MSYSRRKFLATAGASVAGSVLLKGCVGNPPSDTANTATSSGSAGAPAVNVNPADAPEVTTIKLGYIPIVESAPLIVAQEKGFFAKYGMTGVEVSKQANWGSARDNVVIGAAGGGIDGGQWQMPMPHLLSEGLLSQDKQKIPMFVLAQLNTQGNGIAIANKHLGKGFGLELTGARDYILGLKSSGTPFKAAYTFPKANQEFWIRYWLAAGGVNPDTDVSLLTVPAAQTVANMQTGTMDAFSTGDPWPYRISSDNIGFLAALTSQIWKDHPEEYLAIRADWVDKHPKATQAVLKAVLEAQQWCDEPGNRAELATILSGRNFFNLPAEILKGPFEGNYKMGDGKPDVNDIKMGTLYWRDSRGSVSYPYKSHDLWFLTESVRWGFLPASALDDADRIINAVNREDLWKEAAQSLGLAAADIPTETSRGVERFFDGKEFDPANPKAYLESLDIKRA